AACRAYPPRRRIDTSGIAPCPTCPPAAGPCPRMTGRSPARDLHLRSSFPPDARLAERCGRVAKKMYRDPVQPGRRATGAPSTVRLYHPESGCALAPQGRARIVEPCPLGRATEAGPSAAAAAGAYGTFFRPAGYL